MEEAHALDHGDSLILFPEGTRNTTDEALLPFKSGIFHVARYSSGSSSSTLLM